MSVSDTSPRGSTEPDAVSPRGSHDDDAYTITTYVAAVVDYFILHYRTYNITVCSGSKTVLPYATYNNYDTRYVAAVDCFTAMYVDSQG